MDGLRGKIAWVTGAGSGIGESAALKLAEAGAVTVLTGRREAPLAEVAGRIRAAGGTAHVRPADLGKAEQVRSAAEWIGKELGRLDILVSNAGGNITDRAWSRLSTGRRGRADRQQPRPRPSIARRRCCPSCARRAAG